MNVQHETCPFLVPVTGDQLWLYPVSAYCRRPDTRLRVPATDSLTRLCTSDYTACSGFLTAASRMEHGID